MIRTIVLRALCAVAFSLSFDPGRAAAGPTPSPSPSASPIPVIAHLVTSDRGLESAARTARTTYVVTAAQIARNGYRTIADAIENLPGVNVDRYGAFGAQSDIGIRGSSSQQVLVLLDGLPIAGAQIDGIYLEQMATAGVDRIEVVEGGGSTLYGSGSVGGVINIITASQPHPNATLSTGSFGEQTYRFETPYLSFQRTYATNDYPLPNGTSRANSDAGLTAVRVGYSHRIGAIDLAFTGNLDDELLGAPGPTDFSSSTSRESNLGRDLRLNLAQRTSRSTVSLALGASSQAFGFTCDTPADGSCPNAYPTPAPPATTNPPYAQLLYDTRLMASLRNVIGDGRQRLVYGIDLTRGFARIDGGTGDGPFTVYGYAQTAAYLQSQWFARNGSEFYAGLRGEREGAQGGALSPSLGGVLPLSPALQLKLNAATAFRAPTAEDLYYPGYSNPHLQPERTRVGDVTFVAPHLGGGVSFGWFTTSGSNLIVLDANYIPQNIGHASIQGFTLTGKTLPLRGYVATLAVTDLYRAQNLDTDARIYGRGPVFATTLGLHYRAPSRSRFDGFGFSATTHGPQGNPNYTQPPFDQSVGFTRIDGFIGYRIAPKMVLTLRGNDLGNERYAQYQGYPMPGRSFALELRTR